MSDRDLIVDAAERFKRDTDRHEMTVLHDEGLYRHLRFKAPDTGFYWFDLVTWPGYLAFTGDMPGHTFARIRDMFEFFRGPSINPQYWAEKLVTERAAARRYSEERFRALIAEDLETYAEDWPGLREAVGRQILGDSADWDIAYAEGAREAIRDFDFKLGAGKRVFAFEGAWEWDLTDWDWSYLWCCHAIQWGVGQYDARTAVVDAQLATRITGSTG